MNPTLKPTAAVPGTVPVHTPRWLAARPSIRRLGKTLHDALSRTWRRIRQADISTVMLLFGVLVIIMVILGLALGTVNRRH